MVDNDGSDDGNDNGENNDDNKDDNENGFMIRVASLYINVLTF